MTKKYTTVLFDLDGTLIDTNELIIQSYLHTFEQFLPGRFTREDVLPFIGPPLLDAFKEVDVDQAEAMVKVYRQYNMKEHDSFVKAFDGVVETVQALKEHGLKLAIVSTKIRSGVLKGLKFTKLDEYFDVIISLDEVTNAKPNPEPIEKALHVLDSTPEEAIMVGDNYHDILGGKNAGTATCGVAWSVKGKEYLKQYEPDYMLNKMTDLLDIVGVYIK